MTTYFITRHQGAIDWVRDNQVHFDVHLTHLLSLDKLKSGDTVIGTLPIHIIADINAIGVHYVHLSFNVPAHLRGVELSVEQLTKYNAALQAYDVQKLG